MCYSIKQDASINWLVWKCRSKTRYRYHTVCLNPEHSYQITSICETPSQIYIYSYIYICIKVKKKRKKNSRTRDSDSAQSWITKIGKNNFLLKKWTMHSLLEFCLTPNIWILRKSQMVNKKLPSLILGLTQIVYFNLTFKKAWTG